jgi:hypothetical protein
VRIKPTLSHGAAEKEDVPAGDPYESDALEPANQARLGAKVVAQIEFVYFKSERCEGADLFLCDTPPKTRIRVVQCVDDNHHVFDRDERSKFLRPVA